MAAILNGKLLPAAIIHVRRIIASDPSADCGDRSSSVSTACMGLQSL